MAMDLMQQGSDLRGAEWRDILANFVTLTLDLFHPTSRTGPKVDPEFGIDSFCAFIDLMGEVTQSPQTKKPRQCYRSKTDKGTEMRDRLKSGLALRLAWATYESDEKPCFYGWLQDRKKKGMIKIEIQFSIPLYAGDIIGREESYIIMSPLETNKEKEGPRPFEERSTQFQIWKKKERV